MEYHCGDLPQYGIVLVPPSSAEYSTLLADIEKRLANPLSGSAPRFPEFDDPTAPTMILCNRSQTAVAAVSWIWRLEPETGRPTTASVAIGRGTSLLQPFGLDERARKLYGYWHVILPRSKRAIRGNRMLGDNTDVRPPQPDELWTGGAVGAGSGSRRSPGPFQSVTLDLDGVFFLDGGFAGPDTLRAFDRVTADVDAHVQVAKIAREGHDLGLSPTEILARVEALTGPDRGPAPPPPPGPRGGGNFLRDSLSNLASYIGMMRRGGSDDSRVIYLLMSWDQTPVPSFRRL